MWFAHVPNPLDVAFGDPFVLHAADGKFYMYGTSDDINGFRVYVSDDLVTWQKGDVIYDGNASTWGTDCFWAPEVYERDGRYYLFFSANWRHNPNGDSETFRIGVAIADSPTGPFSDLYDRPVFDPGYPVIDANVLWDDTAGSISIIRAAVISILSKANFLRGHATRGFSTRSRRAGYTAWR